MAAEAAQAEVPAPPPPPPPAAAASPEKRALPVPGEAGDEPPPPPEPKRRRACVAALDAVPCADASGPAPDRDADGASFSFQRARGGFVALETTPKFGSFNPPTEAEAEGLGLRPAALPDGEEASPEADEELPAALARGAEDGGTEENSQSQSVGAEVDDGQGLTDKNDDPAVLTSDQP